MRSVQPGVFTKIVGLAIAILVLFLASLIFTPDYIVEPVRVSNLIQCILAVFTLLTAIFAWYAAEAAQSSVKAQEVSANAALDAARESRKAVQAQLLLPLLTEYAKPEMDAANKYIRAWFADNINSIVDVLRDLQQFNGHWPGGYEELDESRRLVSHYFHTIYSLWHLTELLDEPVARAALDEDRVKFYLDYIEPLEWGKRPNYSRDSFEFYIGKYNLMHRPLPHFPNWWEVRQQT